MVVNNYNNYLLSLLWGERKREEELTREERDAGGRGSEDTERRVKMGHKGAGGTKSARGSQPAMVDCRVGGHGGDSMEDHPAGITQGMGEFLSFSSCSWGGGLSLPFRRGIAALQCFIDIWRGGRGSTFLDHV